MVLAVLVAASAVLLLGAALGARSGRCGRTNSLLVEDAHRRRDTELAQSQLRRHDWHPGDGHHADELSTPLSIITARAEQLQSKVGATAGTRCSVRIILEQAERMSQIIRGPLGLAQGQGVAATVLTPQAVMGRGVAAGASLCRSGCGCG